MIFCRGAPADIVFWIVKGLVKESCPSPSGSPILVQLATAGDVIGCADELDEKGNWIRRFQAQAVSKCVVAMITRQTRPRPAEDSGTPRLFWRFPSG